MPALGGQKAVSGRIGRTMRSHNRPMSEQQTDTVYADTQRHRTISRTFRRDPSVDPARAELSFAQPTPHQGSDVAGVSVSSYAQR
jgi:hypothetical protein